jgi:hypothetical protein
MTISVSVLPLLIFNEHKQVVTDTHSLKHLETMSKLIWKLYHQNMISDEVVQILLDKLYE